MTNDPKAVAGERRAQEICPLCQRPTTERTSTGNGFCRACDLIFVADHLAASSRAGGSREPSLITYMTTESGAIRDAAFLRTYAARVRDGSASSWEIPNTIASTIEDIANRIEHAYAARSRSPSSPASGGTCCVAPNSGDIGAIIEHADAARPRSAPAAEDQLRAAFEAGFAWCSSGTDKYGEYNGGSVEDGFTSWSGEPEAEARSAPVEAQGWHIITQQAFAIAQDEDDFTDGVWNGFNRDVDREELARQIADYGIRCYKAGALSSPGAAEPSKE